MADALRKFHSRAFRYVLRTQDDHAMRFALSSGAGAEQTYLLNLSETGCAFLIAPGHEPRLNERIKVEIPIPGGEQMAWFGRVVRVEEHEDNAWLFSSDSFKGDPKVKVGVRFDPLPEGHTRAIRKGLEKSFMQAMRDQQYRTWLYYRTLAIQNFWRAALIAGLLAFSALFFYYFTRPSGNYTPEKGAPWGERTF